MSGSIKASESTLQDTISAVDSMTKDLLSSTRSKIGPSRGRAKRGGKGKKQKKKKNTVVAATESQATVLQNGTLPQGNAAQTKNLDSLMSGIEEFLKSSDENVPQSSVRTPPELASDTTTTAATATVDSEKLVRTPEIPLTSQPKVSSSKVVKIVSHTVTEPIPVESVVQPETPTRVTQEPEVIVLDSPSEDVHETEEKVPPTKEGLDKAYVAPTTATTTTTHTSSNEPILIEDEDEDENDRERAASLAKKDATRPGTSKGNPKKPSYMRFTVVASKKGSTATTKEIMRNVIIPHRRPSPESEVEKKLEETPSAEVISPDTVSEEIKNSEEDSVLPSVDVEPVIHSSFEPSSIKQEEASNQASRKILADVSPNKQALEILGNHESSEFIREEEENIPPEEISKQETHVKELSASTEEFKTQVDIKSLSVSSGSPTETKELRASVQTSEEQKPEPIETGISSQRPVKSEKEGSKRRSRPLSVSDLLEPESLSPLRDIISEETPSKTHQVPAPVVLEKLEPPSSLQESTEEVTSTQDMDFGQGVEPLMESEEVSSRIVPSVSEEASTTKLPEVPLSIPRATSIEEELSGIQKEVNDKEQVAPVEDLDGGKSDMLGDQEEKEQQESIRDKEAEIESPSKTASIKKERVIKNQGAVLFEGSIALSKEPKIPIVDETEASISPLKLTEPVFPVNLETALSVESTPELVSSQPIMGTSGSLVSPVVENEELESHSVSTTGTPERRVQVEADEQQATKDEPETPVSSIVIGSELTPRTDAVPGESTKDVELGSPEKVALEEVPEVTKLESEETNELGTELAVTPKRDNAIEFGSGSGESTPVKPLLASEKLERPEVGLKATLATTETNETHEEVPKQEDEKLATPVSLAPEVFDRSVTEHEKLEVTAESGNESTKGEIIKEPIQDSVNPLDLESMEVPVTPVKKEERESKATLKGVSIVNEPEEARVEPKVESPLSERNVPHTPEGTEVGAEVESTPGQPQQQPEELKGGDEEYADDDDIELSREFEKLRIDGSLDEEMPAADKLVTVDNVLDNLDLGNVTETEEPELEPEPELETTPKKIQVLDEASVAGEQEGREAEEIDKSEVLALDLGSDSGSKVESDNLDAIVAEDVETTKESSAEQEHEKETKGSEKLEEQETKQILSKETGDVSPAEDTNTALPVAESKADKGIKDILAETDAFLKELEFVDDSELNALLESMDGSTKKSGKATITGSGPTTASATGTSNTTKMSDKEIKKSDIIEANMKEPVYIYTSLAGGGFHMIPRTNRLATILQANKIEFTYRDLGTDDEARKVWKTFGKGRSLPAVVRGRNDIIGNWEEVDELNEEYRVREAIYESI